MNRFFLAAFAVFMLSSAAHAVTLISNASVTNWDVDRPDDDPFISDSVRDATDSLFAKTAVGASITQNTANTTATATSSVDGITGEMKLGVTTSFTPEVDGGVQNLASGVASGTVRENFTVSGTGTLTAVVAFDGAVAATPPAIGPAQTAVFGQLTLFNRATNDLGRQTFNDNLQVFGSIAKSYDELLMVEIDVTDGQQLFFEFLLSVQVIAGNGFADFLNTAHMVIQTSDGVSLNFSDSRFLSEAALPGVNADVPLPAGGWLLLTALGAMAVRSRTRS